MILRILGNEMFQFNTRGKKSEPGLRKQLNIDIKSITKFYLLFIIICTMCAWVTQFSLKVLQLHIFGKFRILGNEMFQFNTRGKKSELGLRKQLSIDIKSIIKFYLLFIIICTMCAWVTQFSLKLLQLHIFGKFRILGNEMFQFNTRGKKSEPGLRKQLNIDIKSITKFYLLFYYNLHHVCVGHAVFSETTTVTHFW